MFNKIITPCLTICFLLFIVSGTAVSNPQGLSPIGGVPTILFLDSTGNEVTNARVTGFENPESFLKKVSTVE